MRILFLFLIPGLSILISCKQNSNSAAQKTTDSAFVTEPLYPYPQYIQEQIAYVDTTPLAIEMLVYENGKQTDSSIISREKFNQMAREFMEPDLNQKNLRPLYEERSFQDLTLNTITFSITAKNDTLPIRQADVLLNPVTKKVKNVFIKKKVQSGDGNETKNMLWVHNMNFQVSSYIIKKDGSKTDHVIKVIWDKPFQ